GGGGGAQEGGWMGGGRARGGGGERERGIRGRGGVVAGVIAEGPLDPPLRRVHRPLEHDLGVGGHLHVDGLRRDHGHARPAQPAREHHLVDARRQRRRGGIDARRIAAQRDGHFHGPPTLLSHALVLGGALVDLPVHSQRTVVEDL